VLASSKTAQGAPTDLGYLIAGYSLCARSERKSKNTIDIVINSVRYFEGFLQSEGLPTDVTGIGVGEIRAFILYLQQKRCFSNHPFSRPQERELSGEGAVWPYYQLLSALDSGILELARCRGDNQGQPLPQDEVAQAG